MIISLLYGCKKVLQESGFLNSVIGPSSIELEIPQLKSSTNSEDDIYAFLTSYNNNDNKNHSILTDKDKELGQRLITLRQFMLSRRDITDVTFYYDNNDRNLIISVYTTLQPPGNRDQSKKWVYDERYLFNVLTKSKESSLNLKLKRIQNYGCNLSKNIAYGSTFDITFEVISASGISKSRNCTRIATGDTWVLYDEHSYNQRKYKQRKHAVVVQHHNNSTLLTNVPTGNKPKQTTKMLKALMKRKILQQIKENRKNGKVENINDIIEDTFTNTMKEYNTGHVNITIKNDSPAIITHGPSKRNSFGTPPIKKTHDIFW